MLDTVKINHVQHISFTQSRLTDAVSVILSELLSYEHPSKERRRFAVFYASSRPIRTPMAEAIIRPRVQPELSPRACRPGTLVLKLVSILTLLE